MIKIKYNTIITIILTIIIFILINIFFNLLDIKYINFNLVPLSTTLSRNERIIDIKRKSLKVQELRNNKGKIIEIKYENGEKEIVMYQDNKPTGKAIYYFLNGDREIYNYYNGKIEGEAQYIYFNGYRERYKY